MPPTYEVKDLPLASLRPDVTNPRLRSAVGGDQAAFAALVRQQGKKLANLARDIVVQGQISPADLLIVIPDGPDTFVVVDGNRRLTVLKLLESSALAETILDEAMQRLFVDLRRHWTSPETVRCTISRNREEARTWIQRRHSGEMDGAGQVRWSALEHARWAETFGVPNPTLDLLNFVWTHGTIEEEARGKFWDVNVSSVGRFLGDPKVCELLGVAKKRNRVYTQLGRDQVVPGLQTVVLKVLDPENTVDDFKTSLMLQEFVRAFGADVLPHPSAPTGESVLLRDAPETRGPVGQAGQLPAGPARPAGDGPDEGAGPVRPAVEPAVPPTLPESAVNQSQVQGAAASRGFIGDSGTPPTERVSTPAQPSKSRQKRPEANRDTLIPKSTVFHISHPRLERIYIELRNLNVDEYPNAAAVLLRTFVDLAVDAYITKYELVGATPGDGLSKNMPKVKEHLKQNKLLPKSVAMAAQSLIDGNGLRPENISTMNAYAHSQDMIPIPSELKAAWTRIEAFMELLVSKPRQQGGTRGA